MAACPDHRDTTRTSVGPSVRPASPTENSPHRLRSAPAGLVGAAWLAVAIVAMPPSTLFAEADTATDASVAGGPGDGDDATSDESLARAVTEAALAAASTELVVSTPVPSPLRRPPIASAAEADAANTPEDDNDDGGGDSNGGGSAGPGPWWTWERATGDWGGHRSALEHHGLIFGSELLTEWTGVWSGGVNHDASFRRLFTFDVTLDLERAFELTGGTAFIQYLSINPEDGGSMDVGDFQGHTNLESAEHRDVIYALWYEQWLFNNRLRLKIGKVDANSEFAFIDAAGEFANSSAGFSPAIFAMPSYPDPAMSINVFLTLMDDSAKAITLGYGFYDGAGAADGVPTGSRGPSTFFNDHWSDDYFHILEAAVDWGRFGPCDLPGRFTVGGWLHTGEFERFNGAGDRDDAAGYFLTFSQQITARDEWEGDDRGLRLFAQYGWADDDISAVGRHLGAGLMTRGTFGGRPADSAGIYFSHVDLSDAAGAGFEDDEWAIDAYYRIQATPFLFVQPELQYIMQPSGNPSIDDALVAGVRIGISF